jgi:CelD/BcsL family acetyltransferase involved in cellulose biosynthesis
MRSADTETQVGAFASLKALPSDAATLFNASGHFFSSRAWWDAVLTHAIPPNARPVLLLIRVRGDPAGLFPMLFDPRGQDARALTTPYTCLYEPLIGAEQTDRAAVFTAFARVCRTFSTTRLDALDPPIEAGFRLGAKQAGLAVARFDHFGNCFETVEALDWAAWTARRTGALRETIRRRTRQADRLHGAAFRLFDMHNDLATGIAAFETVYARSWKEPEPFPTFNPAQIRAAAHLGVARLGVWSIGERPAAAQFWIVERRRATVLKLAHDEALKAHSPGTVLTAWMVRHMIEHEHVAELDFGRGDDPYKQGWVSQRRQRTGLMLINPRRPGGMMALAHHVAGRIRARLRASV